MLFHDRKLHYIKIKSNVNCFDTNKNAPTQPRFLCAHQQIGRQLKPLSEAGSGRGNLPQVASTLAFAATSPLPSSVAHQHSQVNVVHNKLVAQLNEYETV